MAKCKYCGEPVGLFKNKHEECEQKYLEGKNKFHKLIKSNVFKNVDWQDYQSEMENIANSSYFSQSDIKPLLIKAWSDAVEEKLKESEEPISKEQALSASHISEQFGITHAELNENGFWDKLVESTVISDLVEGIIPDRSSYTKDDLPIMFKSGEKLVWVFENDTQYHKLQTKSKRVGSYAGYGGRILKGVYYKWGGFQSESIKTMETEHIDTGHLAVTDQNIYFYGVNKAFKLPYSKMLAIAPLNEGVKIQKTHANAYPITLITGEGWFVYNLLVNLHRMATE